MIPVIDLRDYLAGRPGALERTAGEIRDAFSRIGFFVITGHDVPPRLIEQTFAEAKRVHALPMSDKVGMKLNDHNNGYMAMGRYAVWTSDVNKNDKPDLNEAFFIRRERAPDNIMRMTGRRFTGANVWPEESLLPDFRAHILDYMRSMEDFTNRLLPAVSVSLELEPGFFTPHFVESQFNLRLSHYPPVAADANQFGIAPHSDANFMTFLAQSDVPGLQVRTVDGNWIDMPYIPGSFVVNAGDSCIAGPTGGSCPRHTALCRQPGRTVTRSHSFWRHTWILGSSACRPAPVQATRRSGSRSVTKTGSRGGPTRITTRSGRPTSRRNFKSATYFSSP